MAELKKVFRIKKKLFVGPYTASYPIKIFGGGKGPFLGLIPLIPEKNPFSCSVVFRFALILHDTRKNPFVKLKKAGK